MRRKVKRFIITVHYFFDFWFWTWHNTLNKNVYLVHIDATFFLFARFVVDQCHFSWLKKQLEEERRKNFQLRENIKAIKASDQEAREADSKKAGEPCWRKPTPSEKGRTKPNRLPLFLKRELPSSKFVGAWSKYTNEKEEFSKRQNISKNTNNWHCICIIERIEI